MADLDGLVAAVGPVRPGDTLVLRLNPGLNRAQFDEQVDELSSAIKARLDVELLFVAGDVEILHYRPEAA